MKTITDDQLEMLAELVDKADNLLFAVKLPVSPVIHVEGLKHGIEEMREALHAFCVEIMGEDMWSNE